MTGTPSQIEWAEAIKPLVHAEFERVAGAFLAVAARQSGADQADTHAILAILGEIQIKVLAREEAGYFIRDWRELDSQIRNLLAEDPRYQAIKANRDARKPALRQSEGAQ